MHDENGNFLSSKLDQGRAFEVVLAMIESGSLRLHEVNEQMSEIDRKQKMRENASIIKACWGALVEANSDQDD